MESKGNQRESVKPSHLPVRDGRRGTSGRMWDYRSGRWPLVHPWFPHPVWIPFNMMLFISGHGADQEGHTGSQDQRSGSHTEQSVRRGSNHFTFSAKSLSSLKRGHKSEGSLSPQGDSSARRRCSGHWSPQTNRCMALSGINASRGCGQASDTQANHPAPRPAFTLWWEKPSRTE